MFDYLDSGRWWDDPLGLVSGCTPCSPGCKGCWSIGMEKRFHRHPEKITTNADRLLIPQRTSRPRAYAVWNDLFHEEVPQQFIYGALDVMARCRQHIFLILTKRARRMVDVIGGTSGAGLSVPLPSNVWLGVTACNQDEADEKIPLLLQILAAVRFLCLEPALGLISTFLHLLKIGTLNVEGERGEWPAGVDWVIAGGQTGPGAALPHPSYFRTIWRDCRAADIPFYFKQWGSRRAYKIAPPEKKVELVKAGFDPTLANGGMILDGKKYTQIPKVHRPA